MNNDVTLTGGENPLLAGRYQVVRQLGTGGMGSVWLAEDRQLDNKLFAIKMLPSILVANKRAYRQLKDEALVAMKLVHPNIVQIRAFEENNGNPFLVMDYVEGQTLDDYLAEKGKLTEDETAKILKPIAAALDYAHGEGVVHRDVKPANVMIRKDGHPYILDFGIAREIQETMTRVTGKLSSGTLLYMSPEQLNGDPPKPAQDVYSFAAMLYECLNGEPPFSRGNVEYQIMNKMPEPLGSHIIISGLVMQGIAKKPQDRPRNCAAVLERRGRRETQGGERHNVFDGSEKQLYSPIKPSVDRELCTDRKNEAPCALQPSNDAEMRQFVCKKAKITEEKENIKIKCKQVRIFRKDPVGFEDHIASIDRQCRWVSSLEAPSTLHEAETILGMIAEAKAQISKDLDWLHKNRRLRDEVKALDKSIQNELTPVLQRFKAIDYAGEMYNSGRVLVHQGEVALENGNFVTAKETFTEAKRILLEVVSIAGKFFVNEHLGCAKESFDNFDWRRCIEECNAILEMDTSNEDVRKLKDEVERTFLPSAALEILVDGAPLNNGEIVKIGCQEWICPVVWTPSNYGLYRKVCGGDIIEYHCQGRRYFGVIEEFSVNWRGRKRFVVELKECKEYKQGEVRKLALPGGAKMDMIYIAAPQSSYWLGKTQVTQKQWKSVMGANPSHFKSFFGGGNLPVENVSWEDCRDFLVKVQYEVKRQFGCKAKFPTEAQWEYACMAGYVTDILLKGDRLRDRAWCCGHATGRTTHPVATKKPNKWGFYDMEGNVWEWCENYFCRGGSWDSIECGYDSRKRYAASYRGNDVGFRLCCSAE